MARTQYKSQQEPVWFNDQTLETKWFMPWVQPYSNIKSSTSSIIVDPFLSQDPPPFVLGLDRYLMPFSERLFPKPGLATHLQQSLIYSESAQFPESVLESKWHQPFSEPVRFPNRLNPALNPAMVTGAHNLQTPHVMGYIIC